MKPLDEAINDHLIHNQFPMRRPPGPNGATTDYTHEQVAPDSNVNIPERRAEAGHWVAMAARHEPEVKKYKLHATTYNVNHVAIGPSVHATKRFLHAALGREPDPYREGFAVTGEEAYWLGFRRKDLPRHVNTLVHRAHARAANPQPPTSET